MAQSVEQQLKDGLAAMGLALADHQVEQLLKYLSLMSKWNKAYNLTAVRDPDAMVDRHLLDSLAVLPHLGAGAVLDVGTGAGLPGVPLAIASPERSFHLLDANGKKTRFLFQVKTDLGLANMTVHHARVESFQPESPFEMVVSRAFASLRELVEQARHLVAPGGRFLAMKGLRPDDEIRDLDATGYCLRSAHPLLVPGLNEQRHLVELVRA